MAKTLREVLDGIVIYGGEEGDEEWTLSEIDDGASWEIWALITDHLESLKKPVPKPVFGDTTSIENALYNKVIDDLMEDLSEGRE